MLWRGRYRIDYGDTHGPEYVGICVRCDFNLSVMELLNIVGVLVCWGVCVFTGEYNQICVLLR